MRIFGGNVYVPTETPEEKSERADFIGKAAEEIEIMTEKDRMEEFMFLGLRKTTGISCREFRENFGKPIEEIYGRQLRRFLTLELMKKEGDRLFLTERGLDVSNTVSAEFML